MRVIRSKRTPVFTTRREIERYFGGDTIECLICGRHFKRLHTHLAAKHGMAVDEYKRRFGLPWTRGLISATSLRGDLVAPAVNMPTLTPLDGRLPQWRKLAPPPLDAVSTFGLSGGNQRISRSRIPIKFSIDVAMRARTTSPI
jgi:hypothetical protein